MQNSEKTAAVSADMSRIFDGVVRDRVLHSGVTLGEVQARPDLVGSASAPAREDRPRALFTRLIAPAIVVVSLLICIALAFAHYRQSRPPVVKPAPAQRERANPLALFVSPVPSNEDFDTATPVLAAPSKSSHDHGDRPIASTRTREVASSPNARPTHRVRHRSSRLHGDDCERGSSRSCSYQAFRNADARLRAAYLKAMHTGVPSGLLRQVHHEWLDASRQYARRPQETITRYETLRQELAASHDPSPFVY